MTEEKSRKIGALVVIACLGLGGLVGAGLVIGAVAGLVSIAIK